MYIKSMNLTKIIVNLAFEMKNLIRFLKFGIPKKKGNE